jgi:hypothetical protein
LRVVDTGRCCRIKHSKMMLQKVNLVNLYTYTLHRVAGGTVSFILMSGANPLACSVSSTTCLRTAEFSSRSKCPLEAPGKSIDARETRALIAWSTFILRCPSMRAMNLDIGVKIGVDPANYKRTRRILRHPSSQSNLLDRHPLHQYPNQWPNGSYTP